MKKLFTAIALILLFSSSTFQPSFKIAKLKYQGGGDWYANKTSLPNLIAFCNKYIGVNIAPEESIVEAGSVDLFQYPFVHMTGHGNVVFSSTEVQNLRNYLIGGGFLHIDDNYGMDKFIRPELKKIFPESELVELPFTHDIYHQKYNFNNGLPKIHEHDGKTPKGYGILYKGRLVVFYTYECDLGNGWEDKQVYNDSDEVRTKALQMGANIVCYALTTY
jgi:hypothetical protein